ncbi:MAG TPA: hypothetical protein VI564_06475, partial [Candidatus Nanoarchaeia archaeon]|nr:hypothetical protein [Candidatus Nanoarchaeia archaeon]
TDSESGSFDIVKSGTSQKLATFPLSKPKDYNGNLVNCQGNIPCLVGDFSSFTSVGDYQIAVSGIKSHDFTISEDVYVDTAPILIDFFNAQLQQGSDYHADLHSGSNPKFTSISDGSFIMEADQAALTLIRLGSAYRRNPFLFKNTDLENYISSYADYLKSIQGVEIQERTDGVGFRLNPSMKILNAFVPGPTNLSTLEVYIPGSQPQLLETVSVSSLCGADDGTAAWQDCISNAETYYKCQIDEPCLNLKYIDKTGTLQSNSNGFGVSKGWGYEFGCFFDVDLNNEAFSNEYNPCMIFYPEPSSKYTVQALLAYLEALPALNDLSSSKGNEFLARSVSTYDYIKATYPSLSSEESEFFGAALFLLYDYTEDSDYLTEAYGLRNKVSTTFISDTTHGNEFYWEEYVKHKTAITGAGLAYPYSGQNPEEFFRGKIFNDYKDRGQNSISGNGERVYQFDPNIQFQNSRYMLIEGLLASKAAELNSNVEPFIPLVAESQLAWLTGMNAVQMGVAINSPVKSMSFIFGIGDFPKQFHSRYLVDTGYKSSSSGEVIGARGTDYQFLDGATGKYEYLDGKAEILGQTLGALGNEWHAEPKISPYVPGKTFKNGKKYISGWISGAFDTTAESDTIFNYKDDMLTYEYTESTNEIVATAIELYSYMDARLNNRPNSDGIILNISPVLPPINISINITQPGNITINGTNITNGTSNFTDAKIISKSTNIAKSANSSNNSEYKMYETQNASFSVILNRKGTVNWFIDGQLVKTSSGVQNSLDWIPGILFAPSPPLYSHISQVQVRADTGSESADWTVNVEDVINPFFSGVDNKEEVIGSADTQAHVFTNKHALTASKVTVTITNSRDNSVSAHELSNNYQNPDEIDWSKNILGIPIGNNYISKIEIFDNKTKKTSVYELGAERAHYRDIPGVATPEKNDREDTGRESSSQFVKLTPQLVVATFGKDVINLDAKQTIQADAKIGIGGKITAAQAVLIAPDSSLRTEELKLTQGTDTYGTWSAEFSGFMSGPYKLKSIILSANSEPYEIEVAGRSFYVVSDKIGENENLMVVYSVLNKLSVKNGSSVRLSIDARDKDGILSASAQITNSKTGKFEMPLSLIEGDRNYGTWQGMILASVPDSTYSVESITLSNSEGSRVNPVSDRSFYVELVPNNLQGNLITGNAFSLFSKEWIGFMIKKPMVPTLLGFGMMLLIIGGFVIAPHSAKSRAGKKTEGQQI